MAVDSASLAVTVLGTLSGNYSPNRCSCLIGASPCPGELQPLTHPVRASFSSIWITQKLIPVSGSTQNSIMLGFTPVSAVSLIRNWLYVLERIDIQFELCSTRTCFALDQRAISSALCSNSSWHQSNQHRHRSAGQKFYVSICSSRTSVE